MNPQGGLAPENVEGGDERPTATSRLGKAVASHRTPQAGAFTCPRRDWHTIPCPGPMNHPRGHSRRAARNILSFTKTELNLPHIPKRHT